MNGRPLRNVAPRMVAVAVSVAAATGLVAGVAGCAMRSAPATSDDAPATAQAPGDTTATDRDTPAATPDTTAADSASDSTTAPPSDIPAAPVTDTPAAPPPDTPRGAEILQTRCTVCHDLGGLTAFADYWGEPEWRSMIETMIGYGAQVTPEEIPILARYLAEHY